VHESIVAAFVQVSLVVCFEQESSHLEHVFPSRAIVPAAQNGAVHVVASLLSQAVAFIAPIGCLRTQDPAEAG
jgi:hypothetical protein